ncbi:MAG: fused MFS/spermidine synthase [Nitrospirae bacterium]|nr:fused MFS/spermidine synthase [Nitrospirota bacterium]
MTTDNPTRNIPYLILTATISGALVMVLEVLGSKIIGPFFGVSLFVWTSLITVTLLALSIGYAAGGILADKRNHPDYLYLIIALAGILVLCIPFMKNKVILFCQPMGLRSGAFLSTLIIFGPPLLLLGCVSPYIVRLATKGTENIGRVVGIFYALSTLGSFLGTVLTGFVLIAYFSISKTFIYIGLLLLLIPAVYFVVFRKKWVAILCFAAFIPLAFMQHDTMRSKVMQNGTRVTEVFRKDSFYGTLKVVDYSFASNHSRELIIDGLVQGGIDLTNHKSIYEYAYYMELLPYLLNPQGKECLVIGLGAGVIPMWYEKMGIRTDVVDISEDIEKIAKTYFGFTLVGDMHIQDARFFLSNTKKKYDYIILDVFTGDTTPAHLLSKEALQQIKDCLAPEGIVALNLFGSLRNETFITASVLKTLGEVFRTVQIYTTFDQHAGDGIGNLAVMAYDGSARPVRADAASTFDIHPLAVDSIRRHFGKTFAFAPNTPAMVLTDDYNPVDYHDVWMKEQVRKSIVQETDPDILL